tara:strand:- start:633 stop:794 length:162 start_codon:yes stop_codon:yes gene_type:complete
MEVENKPKPLRDAIDFQIGMCALAQISQRPDLLEVSKKRLGELIDKIPPDILV